MTISECSEVVLEISDRLLYWNSLKADQGKAAQNPIVYFKSPQGLYLKNQKLLHILENLFTLIIIPLSNKNRCSDSIIHNEALFPKKRMLHCIGKCDFLGISISPPGQDPPI